MVGRNDPCPCGSGKKYKKCCERVVAIQAAKQSKEQMERQMKSRLLTDLNRWFEPHAAKVEDEWSEKFKQELKLPPDKPIPPQFSFTFRFWLLFDAPCLNGKRPVEQWMKTVDTPQVERQMASELCELHLCCYAVLDVEHEEALLQSLIHEQVYTTYVTSPLQKGMLLFARLSRIGNRYELLGPYTSFGSEMRGEILVHLKNYAQKEEEVRREFWQQNGMQILGWLMQRARNMEQIEKVLASSLKEAAPAMETEHFSKKEWPPAMPALPEEERGVPDVVDQQIEVFLRKHVSGLQERTRAFYRQSLNLFREYVSTRYGKTFTWSKLSEEALAHFFGIWYIDRGGGSPIRSKIFMNTMKHFFRWLRDEAICDIYPVFASVYMAYIHTLPMAFKTGKWLNENAVMDGDVHAPTLGGTYMLTVSSQGATVQIGEKWLPVQINLRGLPPAWMENRFWVRGTLAVKEQESYFTQIDGVYPFFRGQEVILEETQAN
ncbi:hypothetical protein GCM10011571_26320 [Marinithermofilum abyssi]|uniref:SEC-C motif-containing protein n=1 Tax=Marinithermofilum abyssi TaxID=1571185 RepID=A0A8J2VH43_9BACL|nr:SEC-C domain-containing protein [Marinithermofilum abyssi]GGE22991.1 hypothetical protein GCM10011571_26320 [Marinithermofilum abyssi]